MTEGGGVGVQLDLALALNGEPPTPRQPSLKGQLTPMFIPWSLVRNLMHQINPAMRHKGLLAKY